MIYHSLQVADRLLSVGFEPAGSCANDSTGPAPIPDQQTGGRGGVVVTQKIKPTGENGVYDMRTKIVTLTGNVVVSQGGNVMRGDRMVVDLTWVFRIESGKSRPVEMLIEQSQQNGSKPARRYPAHDSIRSAPGKN